MIPGRQTNPGCEVAARSEELGRRCLHRQQRGDDRADSGDLGQPPAALVFAVPRHQLCLDDLQFRLQLRIFLRVKCEQSARQLGQVLIGAIRSSSDSTLYMPLAAVSPNSAA